MTTPDLGIPVVAGSKHRPDCGPACAAMVLAHFGISFTLDEVVDSFPPLPYYGIDIIRLGIFLSRSSLYIKLHFRPDYEIKHQTLLAEFIESGGEITWRPIEVSDICDSIQNGRPTILLVPRENSPRGHYIVMHRINETGIMYNDPIHKTVRRESTTQIMRWSKLRGGLALIAGPPRRK